MKWNSNHPLYLILTILTPLIIMNPISIGEAAGETSGGLKSQAFLFLLLNGNGCVGFEDGMTQSCYTGPPATLGVGECTGGTETCTAGAWGSCTGEILPTAEICGDNLDNDCDTVIDNGCEQCFDSNGFENQTVLIDMSQSILYTADNSSAILRIEMYGNPPAVVGAYTIQDSNYQNCSQCVLIAEGSTYFLANSGTLNVDSVNPFTGSLNGAHLIEVTIDPGTLISTPVPDGETRCVDNYLFNATPP